MTTQEQKLSKFILAINKEAKERRNQILRDAKEYSDRELERAEQEVLNDAYELIQKETANMRNAIGMDLSKKTIEGRRQLILKRDALTDEIFEEAKVRLLEFCKSEKYLSFVLNRAKESEPLLSKPITVYIKESDKNLIPEIQKCFECEVFVNEDILIGGILVSDGKLLIDQTLDGRLSDARTRFISTSALTVV